MLSIEGVDRPQHHRPVRGLVAEQVGQPGAVLGGQLVAERAELLGVHPRHAGGLDGVQ